MNKNIFGTSSGPHADTVNEAGGTAYKMPAKAALAQFAATGCFNDAYYVSGAKQLETVLELCKGIDAEFIAKTAIYARQRGYMKDMPAILLGILLVKDKEIFKKAFFPVVNSGKMLRNFVQVIRSGVVGRKSFGTMPRNIIRKWLASRSDNDIFCMSVGNDPSLADIVKMVHPSGATANRKALYGYLIGREVNEVYLPELVKHFEKFKADASSGFRPSVSVPDVPFQMLSSFRMSPGMWYQIAEHMSWTTLRMNLNTLARNGVFTEETVTDWIADRIRNPEEIKRARIFPYQLMAAFLNVSEDVPQKIKLALQDAMEIAIGNVPELKGRVFVFPDVSGSMRSPLTGYRKGATTNVHCIDVAALITAAIVRKNPLAQVIPFAGDVVSLDLNPRDSVMTNAQRLASIRGGSTNCSAPLRLLNDMRETGDFFIYVSDGESWIDSEVYNEQEGRGRFLHSTDPTATMTEFRKIQKRNPAAKMICIDLQANGTVQAVGPDVINIGGWSDAIFDVLYNFVEGFDPNYWVKQIEAVKLDPEKEKETDLEVISESDLEDTTE